jgi:2-phospho-L-lactate/phosphoenolpyruvate guanylyltransferase
VSAGVVIPVKAFHLAKQRLAGVLAPADRAELARRTAAAVVSAASSLTTVVVCDDPDVAAWADAQGVGIVWCPSTGLNDAVALGCRHLANVGCARSIVVHSDLPLATDLDRFAAVVAVTVVPDDREDGTNLIVVDNDRPFPFEYGRASFRRHCRHARSLGYPVTVVRDVGLALDIDTAADLADPRLKEFLAWLPTSPANLR